MGDPLQKPKHNSKYSDNKKALKYKKNKKKYLRKLNFSECTYFLTSFPPIALFSFVLTLA